MVASVSEIRFELPDEVLRVLDGYCNATGRNRTDVIREHMSVWAEQKVHEAILIMRTTGINPHSPDSSRSKSGK